jgi:hypothetical protein
MELTHYIDTDDNVSLIFESGTVYLQTYTHNEGWTKFTIKYSELKKFMRVVEIMED